MSKRNTSSIGDPCETKKNDYEKALQLERQQKARFEAAWKNLNILKTTISSTEFTEIRRKLTVGDWPASLLGPLDSPSHGYPSVTFVKHAKAVYNSRKELEAARAAATQANDALIECKRTPAYREWVKSQAQTSACGAPCTSRGREGQPCHHVLGIKRCCPNHGPRPALALALA